MSVRLVRRFMLIIGVVFAVVCGGLSSVAIAVPTEPDTPGEIVGSLRTSGETPAPIVAARIDAVPVGAEGDPDSWLMTYTDPYGEQWSENHQPVGDFRLLVPAGSYRVRIQLDGAAEPTWWGGGDGDVVTVQDGEYRDLGTTTLDLPVVPEATLSGRALDAEHAAMDRTEVAVYRDFGVVGWQYIDSAQTDATGRFSVEGLRRGVPLAVCVYSMHGSKYCNGRTAEGLPDAGIQIPADQGAFDAGDLVMPELTVAVAVANADSNSYLELVNEDGAQSWAEPSDGGIATFERVLPGQAYTICGYGLDGYRCLGGADSYAAADKFDVPAGQLVVQAPGYSFTAAGVIRGSVETVGHEAVADAEVRLFQLRDDDGERAYYQVGMASTTDAGGDFSIRRPLVDGDFALCIQGFLQQGTQCSSLAGGAPGDLGTKDFSLRDDQPEVVLTTPITVPRPVLVQGAVKDRDGAASNYGVTLYTRIDDFSLFMGSATTDDDGTYSAIVFGNGDLTACSELGTGETCLGGASSAEDAYTAHVADDTTTVKLPDLVVAGSAYGPCGAIRDNGTVALALACAGQLGIGGTGLRLTSDEDVVTYGCACEGWGVGDAATGAVGYASAKNGPHGLRRLAFSGASSSASGATSTVSAADDTFEVTHRVEPSSSTANAYVVRVSVTNTSDAAAQLRYRRVVDFDMPPMQTNEFVTIDDGDAPEIAFTSNDGFASPDPFSARTSLGITGSVSRYGPKDQGTTIDLDFGELAAGATRQFTLAYGVAESEDQATAALSALDARAYALAVGTSDGQSADGQAAFLAYGVHDDGGTASGPDANIDRVEVASGASVQITPLANDTDPNHETLSIASTTAPRHGTVGCVAGVCTYANNGDGATTDSFGYVVQNESGQTAVGVVRIAISGVDTSPPVNLTPPVLSGTAEVEKTLSVQPGTWQGADLGTRSFTWLASFEDFDGDDGFAISSGSATTYVVPSWLRGASIRVEESVRRSPGSSLQSSELSEPVGPVPYDPYLYASTWPEFSSPVKQGVEIAAPRATWTAVDRSGESATVQPDLSYSWRVNGAQVGAGARYTPKASDVGGALELQIIAHYQDDGVDYGSSNVWVWGGQVLGESATLRPLEVTVSVEGSDAPVSAASVLVCGYTCTSALYDADAAAFVVSVPTSTAGVAYQLHVHAFDGATTDYTGSVTVATGDGPREVAVVLPTVRPTPPTVDFVGGLDDRNVGGVDVPTGVIGRQADFSMTGCAAIAQPSWTVQFANGNPPMSGTLAKGDIVGELATYTALIPGFTSSGFATVSTNVPATCAGNPEPFTIYIDPSGVVTDQFGRPINGADVTLYRKSAATGLFTAVPSGLTSVMDPGVNTNNPSKSGANLSSGIAVDPGGFRWDVAPGSTYRVGVSGASSGGRPCADAISPDLTIPPARVNLLLRLDCAGATPPAASTVPVISGGAASGDVVQVSPGIWPNGIVQRSVSWRVDGVDVPGATGSAYTLRPSDVGKPISAVVTAGRPDYVQENGTGARVSFTAFEYVTTRTPGGGGSGGGGGGASTAPVNTSAPTITGAAKVGRTLTANPGTWSVDGLSFAYQWLRDGGAINGATGADYTASAADLGKQLTVEVTARKTGLPDGSAASGPVTVALGDAPAAVAPPVISWAPVSDEQLRVSTGTWDVPELAFTYQWLRDGEPIAGATASAYTVGEGDRGHSVAAIVTATKDGYADGSARAEGVKVPQPAIEAAETTTTASLKRSTIKPGQRGLLRVSVDGAGSKAVSGPVEIRVDGATVVTRDLTSRDRGRLAVRLPRLAVGTHRVVVVFTGTDAWKASRSDVVRLTVKPKRHR